MHGERVQFANGLAGLLAGTEGPAVVLLHPIGLGVQTWRFVQPALAEGCRTLALDLLGFGASAKPCEADYSVQAHAARVLAAADELGWSRIDFVGNSLGGAVSLAAAIAAPERTASLTLVGTAAYPGGMPPIGLAARAVLAEYAFRLSCRVATQWGLAYCFADPGRLEREAVNGYARVLAQPEAVRAFRLTGQALYGGSLAALVPHYRAIACPALILHGEDDRVVPPWVSERLRRELAHARLRWLARVGHFPQEEDPQQFLHQVMPFVQDRERAAA
jgi:pimeloyl-ACP methyl ester carboxylesterase